MSDSGTSIRLHSRFDPAGEAARYLDENLAGRRPSCVLVLGGAEDWISEAARARLPGSLIISLQLDPRFRGGERPGADHYWYPDSTVQPYELLARTVPVRLDGGVAVVVWKPSEKAFPESAAALLRELRRALEDFTSDAATVRFWSRRWMANSLRNFLAAERYCRLKPSSTPIVVAAAGPSLHSALEALDPFRLRVRLWALTSAAAACLRRGWNPELIAGTDPGFWADRHFDAVLRSVSEHRMPLATCLTARIPISLFRRCSLVLVAPKEAPENDFISAAGLPSFPSSSRGTSAADALSLAGQVSQTAVLAAGLDLAARDLISHCRPYGFDFHIRKPEGRLKPGLSLLWQRETAAFPKRMGIWRRGRAFDLYADGMARTSEVEVLRLLPSPVPVPGTIPLDPQDLSSWIPLDRSDPVPPTDEFDAPNRFRRTALVKEVLESWAVETRDAVSGKIEPPLPFRTRRLFYALGGSEASAFLAQAARGILEDSSARIARSAVERSLSKFRELTE